MNNGTTTVTGCRISDCSSTGFGGGIYNSNNGNLTLEYSEIHRCDAPSGGALGNMGSATITNTEMAYNTANLRGGAIYQFGPVLTIKDGTVIRDNICLIGDGGGIYQLAS